MELVPDEVTFGYLAWKVQEPCSLDRLSCMSRARRLNVHRSFFPQFLTLLCRSSSCQPYLFSSSFPSAVTTEYTPHRETPSLRRAACSRSSFLQNHQYEIHHHHHPSVYPTAPPRAERLIRHRDPSSLDFGCAREQTRHHSLVCGSTQKSLPTGILLLRIGASARRMPSWRQHHSTWRHPLRVDIPESALPLPSESSLESSIVRPHRIRPRLTSDAPPV
ncbi:hypothetical protein QBC44DRAFT_17215 [Cladorrhinum sp. PSN332]|nr:hypothetical protein QBC44DRAFT_17215 [Cladorrhinum sp. PSN332]